MRRRRRRGRRRSLKSTLRGGGGGRRRSVWGRVFKGKDRRVKSELSRDENNEADERETVGDDGDGNVAGSGTQNVRQSSHKSFYIFHPAVMLFLMPLLSDIVRYYCDYY